MKAREITEAAKPKGVVDKKFGKAEKASKSGFAVGQRVAIEVGPGQVKHGNIVSLDIKSGGAVGAMVKYADGAREFYPYAQISDASGYWDAAVEKNFARIRK